MRKMDDGVFQQHGALETTHWWFQSRYIIIKNLLDLITQPSNDDLLLDVGCGTGGMTSFLSKDYRCTGIDTSTIAINMARILYPESFFVQKDLQTFLQESKDQITTFLLLDVLEHIEDDEAFLKAIIKHASPGAHILITVPAKKEFWSQHDISAGHFRRYEHRTLAKLWENEPSISVRLLSYYNMRLYPIIRFIRYLCNKLNITAGKNSTDFRKTPKIINFILKSIFSGERGKLTRSLDRSDKILPYKKGVSLIAVLKKS